MIGKSLVISKNSYLGTFMSFRELKFLMENYLKLAHAHAQTPEESDLV